ncbi:unnamed protein product, partial [Nesidiocoris tenuis]
MAISPKRPRPPVSAEVQDLEVLQRRECYAPDLETVQGLGCCIARAIASGQYFLVIPNSAKRASVISSLFHEIVVMTRVFITILIRHRNFLSPIIGIAAIIIDSLCDNRKSIIPVSVPRNSLVDFILDFSRILDPLYSFYKTAETLKALHLRFFPST